MRRLVPALALLAACNPPLPGDTDEVPDDGKLRFTILHTNDWQSHMLGIGPNAEYTPETTGDDDTRGGLARTKALVDQIRAGTDHQVLLLDGGDWMAGALFQLLATSHAAELQMMQDMGYDAITFGNHELDWGPAVLGQMIDKADANGVTVPIISSNLVPNAGDAGDDPLEKHFNLGRIETTRVLTLENGLTIGLFGIVGDGAAQVAPAVKPARFDPAIDATGVAVAELQGQGVDLIVGMTHNGVTDDPTTSPDELLANAVDGIDVIVGGHSHTPLLDYRTANGTLIVQAGSHTKYLGELKLAYDPEAQLLEVEGYKLHEIDDTIAGDPDAIAKIEGFVAALDSGPLAELGFSFHEPVLGVSTKIEKRSCEESGLGNLITDSYVAWLTELDPERPIDAAFEAQGVIRESLYPGASGTQGFSDVFNVLPLGFGQDQAVADGYALTHFWVTGAELRDACEVTATIAPDYGCSYWIEVGGIRCTMDMSWLKSSRVHTVEKWTGSEWQAIDLSPSNPALYHVATDSYIAGLMSSMKALSGGALEVEPKDELGNPITDPAALLFDADPTTSGVQEVKLWEAVIRHSQSFPDLDGDDVPDVPDSYATPAGRVLGYQ